MKRFNWVSLVLLMNLCTGIAQASGCMWYERFELGEFLATDVISGTFTCGRYIGVFSCTFRDDRGQLFKHSEFRNEPLPPPATPVSVVSMAYAAMQWFDCDGGDPTPPFAANGRYELFTYEGIDYFHFSLDESLD